MLMRICVSLMLLSFPSSIMAGGFCPSCALRALGLTDNAFTNNGNQEDNSRFYSRNMDGSQMFGGDPQTFGTNLGKQIAMRIMQAYDGKEEMGGEPIVINSLSSFPETKNDNLNLNLGTVSSTGNTSEPAKLVKLEENGENEEKKRKNGNQEDENRGDGEGHSKEDGKESLEMTTLKEEIIIQKDSNSGGSFDPNEFAKRFREQYLQGGAQNSNLNQNNHNHFGSFNGNNGFNGNTMPPVFGSFSSNNNGGNVQMIPMAPQPNKGKCPYCFGNNGNYKKARKMKRRA